MESLIFQDNTGVKAAVSLFGLPWENGITNYSVPILYILGKNDPIVNFHSRNRFLKGKKIFHPKLTIASYPNEGHWFRNRRNLQDAVCKMLNQFSKYSNHD